MPAPETLIALLPSYMVITGESPESVLNLIVTVSLKEAVVGLVRILERGPFLSSLAILAGIVVPVSSKMLATCE